MKQAKQRHCPFGAHRDHDLDQQPRVAIPVPAQHQVYLEGEDVLRDWGTLDPADRYLFPNLPHGSVYRSSCVADVLELKAWLLRPWAKQEELRMGNKCRFPELQVELNQATDDWAANGRLKNLASGIKLVNSDLDRMLEDEALTGLYRDVDLPVAHLLSEMEAIGIPVVSGRADLSALSPKKQTEWSGWPAEMMSFFDDGRFHPRWSLTTKTGRIATPGTNIQGLPKVIRHTVAAPPGKAIVAVDLSSADFRAIAAMSGDRGLLQLLADGGNPYYEIGEGAGPDARGREHEVGKAAALKPLYSHHLFHDFTRREKAWLEENLGQDLDLRHSVDLVKHYQSLFPRVWEWRDQLRTTSSLVHRNPFGRQLRPRDPYLAPVYLAQSSVADLVKRAMLRIAARLPEEAYLIINLHDELVVESLECDVEEVTAIIVKEMTAPLAELPVPLAVKAGSGRTWAEAVGSSSLSK